MQRKTLNQPGDAMQPRLNVNTDIGQYEPREWNGEDTSGLYPVGEYVVILPDLPASQIGSIQLTDDTMERAAYAAETGVLVAVGEGAFKFSRDRMREFVGRKPVPGDRVFFERYAGGIVIGDDGERYRVAEDRQIAAICLPGEPKETTE